MLIFCYPHREHFAAFVCQSGLLIVESNPKRHA
ncbi:hypothetical protein LTSEADE_0003, partial [Salmonella enterica subsp. enterica serovar Adelaide str. A4-669]